MTYDVDQEKKKEKKKFKGKENFHNRAMQDILDTPSGQYVINEIMEYAGLMSPVASRDAAEAQRQLGRRDVALFISDWATRAHPAAMAAQITQRAQELENEEDATS